MMPLFDVGNFIIFVRGLCSPIESRTAAIAIVDYKSEIRRRGRRMSAWVHVCAHCACCSLSLLCLLRPLSLVFVVTRFQCKQISWKFVLSTRCNNRHYTDKCVRDRCMRSVLWLPCVRFIRLFVCISIRFDLIPVQSQFLSKMSHIKNCSCKRSAPECIFSFQPSLALALSRWHHNWAPVHSWPQTNSALNLNGKFTMIFALFRFSATVANKQ